jgi:hypothetical protein
VARRDICCIKAVWFRFVAVDMGYSSAVGLGRHHYCLPYFLLELNPLNLLARVFWLGRHHYCLPYFLLELNPLNLLARVFYGRTDWEYPVAATFFICLNMHGLPCAC